MFSFNQMLPRAKNIATHRLFFLSGVILCLWILSGILAPNFLNFEVRDGNIYSGLIDIFNRSVPVALLAIGMSLVIATGGIDLSVGAIIAITGAVCAQLITQGNHSLLFIFLAGISVGLCAGIFNALLIGILGIQPIVATLVLMVAGRGFAQLINQGQIVTFHRDDFSFLGVGHLLALPFPIWLLLSALLLSLLLTRKTALGLFIEAVGANPLASKFSGVNLTAVIFCVYGFSGICAAISGMVITADIQGADANNAGLWLELDAILAVVIGGASLQGGRFYLIETVLGVLLIQSLSALVIVSGIPATWNILIKAIAILIILLLQNAEFQKRFKKKFFRQSRTAVPTPPNSGAQ